MLARTFAVACAAAAALAAVQAWAEPATESTAEPMAAWALAVLNDSGGSGGSGAASGKGVKKLGIVLARGNTDTTTANAKFELVRTTRAVKDDFEIEGLYGKTGALVTAER